MKRLTLILSVLALALSSFCSPVLAGMFESLSDRTTQSAPQEFSHSQTGFPLTGAHLQVECGTCHAGGVFKGTPRNCAGCHSTGSRIVSTTMSTSHIVTTDPCELCHTSTATFLGARFNHGNALPGSCTTCHNGRIAAGRPSNHSAGLMAADSCEKCHRMIAWLPANFNHNGVASGSCAQCHNGTLATGKPGSHTTTLKSTSTCDTCHRYTSWFPTFYNHASVAPGSCSTCHDGTTATGKPAAHVGLKATMACDQCHNTYAWMPARYNHVGVAPGNCTTCHNGASATGKPPSHSGAKASMSCDSCHNTSTWASAVYNHRGVVPGGCLSCHAAQRPTSHTARGYIASCDACHAIGSRWSFNHALQQGRHTCNSCHSKHHDSTPCDNCHSVNRWD